MSKFGGSAWEWDAATGQFYYHVFLAAQPDLNWRNQEVREAMYDVLRFWIDRGVDGFRVDAIANLVEDDLLRDNPPIRPDEPVQPGERDVRRIFTLDRPETHTFIAQMREVIDAAGARC